MIFSDNISMTGMEKILEIDSTYTWDKVNYIDSINYYIVHDDNCNDYSILDLGLRSIIADICYTINVKFINVNNLCLRYIGGKYNQIFGFEIIDKSKDGWENEQRYLINDYENHMIKFTCKEIKVVSVNYKD